MKKIICAILLMSFFMVGIFPQINTVAATEDQRQQIYDEMVRMEAKQKIRDDEMRAGWARQIEEAEQKKQAEKMAAYTLYFSLFVLATAVWVGFDAKNLGVKKGSLGGGMLDMSPLMWFIATLLLWIVGFPAYLATRSKYKVLAASKTA